MATAVGYDAQAIASLVKPLVVKSTPHAFSRFGIPRRLIRWHRCGQNCHRHIWKRRWPGKFAWRGNPHPCFPLVACGLRAREESIRHPAQMEVADDLNGASRLRTWLGITEAGPGIGDERGQSGDMGWYQIPGGHVETERGFGHHDRRSVTEASEVYAMFPAPADPSGTLTGGPSLSSRSATCRIRSQSVSA